MTTEKRQYPRIPAKGIATKITITSTHGATIFVDATILDISQSGIRLWLKKPIPAQIGELINLEIILPISGSPLIIAATIAHCQSEGEFGANYIDIQPEDPIDKLLQECSELD